MSLTSLIASSMNSRNVFSTWGKLLLSLLFILSSVNLSSQASAVPRGAQSRDYWDDDDDVPDPEIATGYIVLAVIITLFIFIGIPVLLCFCCAWCCFKNCRGNRQQGTIIAVVPPPGSYPQQQYNAGYQSSAYPSTGVANPHSQIGFIYQQRDGMNPPPYFQNYNGVNQPQTFQGVRDSK